MQLLLIIPALGALLSALPAIHGLDPLTCTLILHATATALCAILTGELSPATITWGSLAAVAGLALWSLAPAFSVGMMMFLLFAPRALREPTAIQTVFHSGAAFCTGLLSGWLAHGWSGAGPDVELAVLLASGAAAASPWILPVDDALTSRMRSQVLLAPDALRPVLASALGLRVRTRERMANLPRGVRRDLEGGWRELAQAVDVRLKRPGAADTTLESQIHTRVMTLQRAYLAADRCAVLTSGTTQHAHARVQLHAERLDEHAVALMEVNPAL